MGRYRGSCGLFGSTIVALNLLERYGSSHLEEYRKLYFNLGHLVHEETS